MCSHRPWVTAQLSSASFPSVSSGYDPNSASETLLVFTHTVKLCSILAWILYDLTGEKKKKRLTRKTCMTMCDYIIIGFDRMWQTFNFLSRPNIINLACLNMVFFEECTCCLIVSLIFFSESFPLNPFASAIKQQYVLNYLFCIMMFICIIRQPCCICHDF